MGWLYRIISATNVARHSSLLLANAGTALVSILIVPGLDVIFSVLLESSLGSPNLVTTAYASVLVQCSMVLSTSMCASVAIDKEQEIISAILSRRTVDLPYWIGIAIPGALAGCVTGVPSAVGVLLLEDTHNTKMLVSCIALLPSVLTAGVCLGVFVSGVGLPLTGSFAALNVMTALALIATMTIIPVRLYPAGLRDICRLLPLTPTVTSLSGHASWTYVMIQECGRGTIIVLLGLAASLLASHLLREGRLEPMN